MRLCRIVIIQNTRREVPLGCVVFISVFLLAVVVLSGWILYVFFMSQYFPNIDEIVKDLRRDFSDNLVVDEIRDISYLQPSTYDTVPIFPSTSKRYLIYKVEAVPMTDPMLIESLVLDLTKWVEENTYSDRVYIGVTLIFGSNRVGITTTEEHSLGKLELVYEFQEKDDVRAVWVLGDWELDRLNTEDRRPNQKPFLKSDQRTLVCLKEDTTQAWCR